MKLDLSRDKQRLRKYIERRVKDYSVYVNCGPGEDADPLAEAAGEQPVDGADAGDERGLDLGAVHGRRGRATIRGYHGRGSRCPWRPPTAAC